MLTDYHSHLLPGMDDGASNTETSLRMLNELREQGIERVAATPHFYAHRESVSRFLERRTKSLNSINGILSDPVIITGAEVSIEKSASETKSLESLALNGGKHILLELPWASFKNWMTEEIYNIAYYFKLTPVIAHLERYLRIYGKNGVREVLAIQDSVIQINNEALEHRTTRNFALELIRGGFPVVFGSDAHDMDSRPPDFDRALKTLRSKLDKSQYITLMNLNENLV